MQLQLKIAKQYMLGPSGSSKLVCDLWGFLLLLLSLLLLFLLKGYFLFKKKKIEEISVGNQIEYLLSFHSDLSVGDTFE